MGFVLKCILSNHPIMRKRQPKECQVKKILFEYVIYCFYLGYVRNNLITHEEYKKCLFNETDMCHAQTRIGQKGHQLHTIETKKTSLSPFNDKRCKTKN